MDKELQWMPQHDADEFSKSNVQASLADAWGPPSMVPSYTLNAGQQSAFDELMQFCLGKHHLRKFTFSGAAGTGKSFTVSRIVEAVRRINPSINFGMTAPTHKAVRVLKKQSDIADSLDFGTIHSFLGLKQVIDQTTGDVEYKPDFDNGRQRKIDGVNVLFVDETSMLDDKLHGFIEDELRSNNRIRVVYTGDKNQLQPVGKKQATGESRAIPFIPERREAHKIGFIEITEPQRQAADSPIIMYAHSILAQNQRQHIDFDFKEEYKSALEVVPRNRDSMTELVNKYFKTEEFQADPDYCKILAWRNATVDFFNKMVRRIIYNFGDEDALLDKIIVGEKLVMEEPVVIKDRVILTKNEDVRVESVVVKDIELRYKLIEKQTFGGTTAGYNPLSDSEKYTKIVQIKVYLVKLINDDKEPFVGYILHEESEKLYEDIRNSIKKAALNLSDRFEKRDMWKEFYSIQQKFMWTNYNYALTIHKSQGSSYQFCILNEWDIAVNRDIEERNQLRYVGATRPRQKLFIVK